VRPSGLNFADFHIGINRQLGVTDWRTRWRGSVLCQDLELRCPGTVDLIAVPVALGVLHAKRTGGDQLVERGTVAIQGDVAALRLRDLQQISADAGQADGLRGSSAGISRGHSGQIEVVDPEKESSYNKKNGKGAHTEIVYARRSPDKHVQPLRIEKSNPCAPAVLRSPRNFSLPPSSVAIAWIIFRSPTAWARPHRSAVASFERRKARAYVAGGGRMSSSEGRGNPSRPISRNQRLLGQLFSTIQKFMGDCRQSDHMTAAILHYSGSRHTEYVSSANRSKGVRVGGPAVAAIDRVSPFTTI
jgi:hypothetical protein